jgi:hypothetical protein
MIIDTLLLPSFEQSPASGAIPASRHYCIGGEHCGSDGEHGAGPGGGAGGLQSGDDEHGAGPDGGAGGATSTHWCLWNSVPDGH